MPVAPFGKHGGRIKLTKYTVVFLEDPARF